MDRRALILYLENVSDLEVAKAIVGRMYNRDKQLYEKAIKERNSKMHPIYSIPNFKYEPRGRVFVFCAFMAIACAIMSVFLITGMMLGKFGNMSWIVLIFLLGTGLFYGLMTAVDPGSKRKQEAAYQRKIDSLKKQNEQAAAQNAEISRSIESLDKDWRNRNEWYISEYSKISDILQEFYSMNIIPVEYRNTLAAICLYAYMSNSQETFDSALFFYRMEEIIRRIEAKEDKVIGQVLEDIYERRLMREETKNQIERTISQNDRMLRELELIENNSHEASQYAKLASNYSKANAYFSHARYLDKEIEKKQK